MNSKAAPTRDLGDGLTMRWSRPEDSDRLVELIGTAFRPHPDSPPNDQFATEVRMLMRGDHPLMGPGDFAIVEDSNKTPRPVVAATCLWRHEWLFDDIPLSVGRPEFVATDPAYRNRGLVRALFQLVHARSSAEGHLMQAITGIPYFYRQLGYEYALHHFGARRVYSSNLPPMPSGAPPYSVRPAVDTDAPVIQQLYAGGRRGSLVWNNLREDYWRYQIRRSNTEPGSCLTNTLLLLDDSSRPIGFATLAAARQGPGFRVHLMEIGPGIAWIDVVPFLIHAFQQYGERLAIPAGCQRLSQVDLYLGRAHPAYDVLGEEFAPFGQSPETWYVRVEDLVAFISHITPVLESRLAASSVASHYTGALHLDFFRDGLRLAFENGLIARIESGRAPIHHSAIEARASFPPNLILKLIFGHSTVGQLADVFPDVLATHEAALVLGVLFPRQPSSVFPPDVTNA